MNNNGLLQCPNCLKLGKKQILGKILENGQFLVLRFHHGTTLISSQNYTISCGCGYQFNVNGGTIVITQVSLPISNEGQAIPTAL